MYIYLLAPPRTATGGGLYSLKRVSVPLGRGGDEDEERMNAAVRETDIAAIVLIAFGRDGEQDILLLPLYIAL